MGEDSWLMGVEYAHGLFVADLQWRPSWERLDAIQRVLESWQLASGPPRLWTMEPFRRQTFERGPELPANFRAGFTGSKDRAVIERVIGPSDARNRDRYLGISVVLGVDFRIVPSDSFDPEIVTPPMNGADPVELDETSNSFPASWTTTPPVVTATGFSGLYRSMIELDCGKDVPRICDRGAPLPEPALRAELEAALGTALIEAGWIH